MSVERTTARIAGAVAALVLAAAAAAAAAPAVSAVSIGAPQRRAQNRAPAAEPTLEVSLSSGVVRLGAPLEIRVAVEGAQDADLGPLPSVEGLTIGPAGTPQTTEYSSFFNGRSSFSRSVAWRIPVRALREGEFEIPPLTVSADGRELSGQSLALAVVRDMRGEDLGYFRIDAGSERWIEGLPVIVDIEFGWDAKLAERVNYAALSLPWWGAIPGAVEKEIDEQGLSSRAVRIPVNGEREELTCEALGTREVDGRKLALYRGRYAVVPTRPGPVELAGSVMEFGEVERSAGFFGASARKVQSYYVSAAPLAAAVEALPESGRPLDFGGALGSIQARASADRRDVTAGDSIKLTVEWSGRGNFEYFEAPDPARDPDFAGFRCYGATEAQKSLDGRRVVYDLAPLSSEVRAIPPLELQVFDPETMRYAVVATEPISIRVSALEGATALLPEGTEELYAADIADVRSVRPSEAGAARTASAGARPALVAAAGSLAGVLAAFAVARPSVRRRRLARDLAAAGGASAELEALWRFLGARTGEGERAWLGRSARAWGEADARSSQAGSPERRAVDPAALASLDQLVARLEREAYSGAAGAPGASPRAGAAAVAEVADQLIAGGL